MSKLFIESDGTANGTYVFVGEKELEGVRRIEILIDADGSSSVAIETDEQEVEEQDEVCPHCGCCHEAYDEDPEPEETPEEVVEEAHAGPEIELTPSLEAQLKALVAAGMDDLRSGKVVSQEEAKQILAKLLDPALVQAAKGVLVVDLRQ